MKLSKCLKNGTIYEAMAESFRILNERSISEVDSNGKLANKIFVVVKINGEGLAVLEFLADEYDPREQKKLIEERLNYSYEKLTDVAGAYTEFLSK